MPASEESSSPDDVVSPSTSPLFVTWKKLHRGETYHLRGCIGTFSPLQLQDGLREYSLISALRDSRFDPVELDEVPQLQVGISLLMHFEDGADWQDWTVGKHGISIKFSSARGKRFSATYLPEVASEQGWDVPETLESLVRKAGYRGPVNAQLLESIKLTRYQSQKTSLTYAEYQEARKALLAG